VSPGKKSADAPAVFALSRPSRCYGCDQKLPVDAIVKLEDKENDREVQCRNCAGLADLEHLAAGNAAITRLARKYSKQQYIVLKWSDAWKCYERQGILVEPQAIDRAEQESGTSMKNRKRIGCS
jgi:hypothetical protein